MRFFSSSALPKAEKLRLAASCSAADAMNAPAASARMAVYVTGQTPMIRPRSSISGESRPRCLRSARLPLLAARGASTEPPAFSIAATADFDAPPLRRSSLALISPLPRIFTPSRAWRSTPASTRARRRRSWLRRIELAGVDRLLDAAEIDFVVIRARRVAEAALGQTAMQRHLAAFKALDRDAGARLLALDAASAGLALAGADTAADAHALLGAPGLSEISLSFI